MDKNRFLVYTLGHTQIDSEHIFLLNSMAIAAGMTTETEVTEALSKLSLQVALHFANEETLMLNSSYPYMRWHAAQHATFLLELSNVVNNHLRLARPRYSDKYFGKSLEMLMLSHIDHYDRQLADWLASKNM